jgi:hypothetical protein
MKLCAHWRESSKNIAAGLPPGAASKTAARFRQLGESARDTERIPMDVSPHT